MIMQPYGTQFEQAEAFQIHFDPHRLLASGGYGDGIVVSEIPAVVVSEETFLAASIDEDELDD